MREVCWRPVSLLCLFLVHVSAFRALDNVALENTGAHARDFIYTVGLRMCHWIFNVFYASRPSSLSSVGNGITCSE